MTVEFGRTLDRDRAPWKLLVWLVLGALGFSLLDYVGNRSDWVSSSSLHRLANVGREDSLHNFVSSVQELIVAAVALVLYLHARRTETRWARFEWGVAVAFFTWVGFDDGASIHERVGTAVEDGVAFFPSYAWQVVFVPIFTVALLITAHVVIRTRRAPWTRILLVAGFACYVLAVALDYLEGRFGAYDQVASTFAVPVETVSHYSRVVEELFEDVGASLFLVVLLRHLLFTVGSFRLAVVGRSAPDAAE